VWTGSYWPDSYWTGSYWCKTGGAGAQPAGGGSSRFLPLLGVGSAWLIGAVLGSQALTALLPR
jgi:hypothetical protein